MKTTLLTIVAITAVSLGVFAEDAPKSDTSLIEILLDATQSNDLAKFEAVCDDEMKAAMTEENLKDVSDQIAEHMKVGYKKVYLGVLNRGEYNTYLWKIDYDEEGVSDSLAELSTSDGLVVGFYIR
jgi:hypothetical protein